MNLLESSDIIRFTSRLAGGHNRAMLSQADSPDPAAVAEWRRAERARLLALRTSIPLSERRRYDALMTGTLLREVTPAKGAVIGFYWPMKGEFDPREAIHALCG